MSKENGFLVILILLLALLPLSESRFYVFLGTDILIMGLFAVSLNLLLGYTGLVSFGQAAYFGVGAYTCALLMKKASIIFPIAFVAAAGFRRHCRLDHRVFLRPADEDLFRHAYPGLFPDCVGHCLQMELPHRRRYGAHRGQLSRLPGFSDAVLLFHPGGGRLSLYLLRRVVNSPFGRILTTIRENPERTVFIGINVKFFQLISFMISGFFAGIAGALFGIFNHSIFPDFIFWPQSAEVLIMSLLGGIYNFFGPLVGAAVLLYLRMQVTSFTQYWPLILGTILALILFFFPGGSSGF